ncbi:UbiA family prenyltransferase [Defluviimonas aestuarii]|uniref:UbiA family prenyltransferase n=1 Tax=Albidovulum aestuarii TaxID=1130726 RepID=UPI00249A6EE5|nr:UbiA family prenyltransferase [Defluviimonas aestuarii]MDI3337225.1 UbiA family prenyltransferase [Defluviimonas aestuarii]
MVSEEETAAGARSGLLPYLYEIRPHQWAKNVLIFVPMLAAHRLDMVTFSESLAAFCAFCLIASSVYVLNDLLDLESDRAHPRKRFRPIASGAVPLSHARWMATTLLVAGFGLAIWTSLMLALVAAGYYAATLAYSLVIKRQPILDIWLLAGLYTTRILAGAAATEIGLSVWLLAFSGFFFSSLAAVKRQAELVDGLSRGKSGAAGRGYRVDDLPLISQIGISAGYVAVLVMALYIESHAVAELYPFRVALLAICPILFFWITRMVMVAHRGNMHDDPIVFAFRDRASQICLVAIGISVWVATSAPFR